MHKSTVSSELNENTYFGFSSLLALHPYNCFEYIRNILQHIKHAYVKKKKSSVKYFQTFRTANTAPKTCAIIQEQKLSTIWQMFAMLTTVNLFSAVYTTTQHWLKWQGQQWDVPTAKSNQVILLDMYKCLYMYICLYLLHKKEKIKSYVRYMISINIWDSETIGL